MLQLLEEGASLDDPEFKELGDRLIALGVIEGSEMKSEIQGMVFLARSRGWLTEKEIQTIPATVKNLRLS